MGKVLAGLLKGLKGLAKTLGKALSKVLAKFLVLFVAWEERLVPNEVPEVISRIVTNLSIRFVSNTPEAQEAAREMILSLGQAMLIDYLVVLSVFLCCCITLIVFIGLPLTYKSFSRPRLRIFISFNRAREDIAQNLQQCLEGEGARIYRIPFQEGATHQSIVVQATDGIKRCDSFVCLPGQTQSYVEHEVLAATATEKPIAFLISESSGTLPNTADKRYPVFRLETTIREQFKPLISFLGYVGADLRSTWKICKQALSHPFMSVSVSATLIFGGSCLVALWAYCLYDAFTKSHNLIASSPRFAEVETPVVMAHVLVLGLLVLSAFVVFLYVLLFVVNLLRQFHARRRARLKTVAAQFNRDEWIGVVPDLSPGGGIYESLFESAPIAHHEREGERKE